jgi:two-component system, OmpR family, sensor kinase
MRAGKYSRSLIGRTHGNSPEFRAGAYQPKRTAQSTPKSAREALLEARIAELEQQLQALEEFLAIAAHELRNPMTPISAQLELLVAKVPESGGGSGLIGGLKRLEQLVDAYLRRATLLLEVSRIRSGTLRLQSALVNLSPLVREVTNRMMPLADRAGCSVHLTVEEGLIVRCDAMAMEQVLENLLSNAVRYGPGGPIEVTLSTDGVLGRLSVRDEGIGIRESERSRIFEPFQTVRRINGAGGFGVGLWVTRRLVSAMQGEIAVASTPGAGSTFTVTLPASAGEPDGH